jgi:hypothetical protein
MQVPTSPRDALRWAYGLTDICRPHDLGSHAAMNLIRRIFPDLSVILRPRTVVDQMPDDDRAEFSSLSNQKHCHCASGLNEDTSFMDAE